MSGPAYWLCLLLTAMSVLGQSLPRLCCGRCGAATTSAICSGTKVRACCGRVVLSAPKRACCAGTSRSQISQCEDICRCQRPSLSIVGPLRETSRELAEPGANGIVDWPLDQSPRCRHEGAVPAGPAPPKAVAPQLCELCRWLV